MWTGRTIRPPVPESVAGRARGPGGETSSSEPFACYDRGMENIFRELVEIMRRDESKLERGIQVQAVATLLERLADHCTNLAEQVIFLVKGEDVRHAGKLGKQ